MELWDLWQSLNIAFQLLNRSWKAATGREGSWLLYIGMRSCAREMSISIHFIPLQVIRKRDLRRIESNGVLATTSNVSAATKLTALLGRGNIHREGCYKYMAGQDRASQKSTERPKVSSGNRGTCSCACKVGWCWF